MKTKEELLIYRKEYYLKNKEKINKKNAEWRVANVEQYRKLSCSSYHKRKKDKNNIKHYIIKNAKARAVKKGLPFDITEEDIYLPDICPIMKKPFNRDTRKYGYSIDRIDPTKGYTKDNIWIISQIANAMKWDSNLEERVAFAKWVMSLDGGGKA